MTPTTIEDRRHLLISPEPADLARVKLGRFVALSVVAQGADGTLRVTRTLGAVWSVSPDAAPDPTDASGSALRALAEHYLAQHGGKLPKGAAFALRVLNR